MVALQERTEDKNQGQALFTEKHRLDYAANGYVIVKNVFSAEEVAFYREHYMTLRGKGTYPGDFDGVDLSSTDPLKKYPRMIHMHRWDEASLKWMIDARLNACLTGLLGKEPFAVQTMLYFKPAGARGQALHQDNFYLRVKPSNCIAAWMALDNCDEENGCLQIVPGSHLWSLLCTMKADTNESFTDVTVPIPEDADVDPIIMEAGDVCFFSGTVVHGSYPNNSKDRFRRALIGHYIEGDAQEVGGFYHPTLRMDGTEVKIAASPGGDPCGVWVERDGKQHIEMQGQEALSWRTE